MPPNAPSPEEGRTYDQIRAALFDETNRWRTGQSVGTLVRDGRVDELIQRHVEDKAACGYHYSDGASDSGHHSCDGTGFAGRQTAFFSTRAGSPMRITENMYLNSEAGMGVADAAVLAWANSPGHRANMIDTAVGVMGVGYAEGIIGERDSGGGLQRCSAARDAEGYFMDQAAAEAGGCLSGAIAGQVFASIDPAEEGFYSAMARVIDTLEALPPPDASGGDGGGGGGGGVVDPPAVSTPPANTGNVARLDNTLRGLYVYYSVLSAMSEFRGTTGATDLPQSQAGDWSKLLQQHGYDLDSQDLRKLYEDEAGLAETSQNDLDDVFDVLVTSMRGTISTVIAAGGTLADADVQILLDALDLMGDALMSISPGEYDTAARSARQLSLATARVVSRRMSRLRARPSSASAQDAQPLVASAATDAETVALMGLNEFNPHDHRRSSPTTYQGEGASTWIQGHGSFAYQDAEDSLQAYEHLQHGVLIGMDRFVSDQVALGAYVGLGEMDTSYEARGSGHDAQQLSLGLYGLILSPSQRSYLETGIGAHLILHEQTRGIQVGATQTVDADYDSLALSLHLGAGMIFDVRDLILEPEAALEYLYHDVDGFTETGSSPLRLSVGNQKSHNLNTRLGVNLFREFVSTNGYVYTPWLGLHYLLETSLKDRDIPARFAIVPGASGNFVLQGREGIRHYYQQDIGLRLTSPDNRIQAHGDYSLIASGKLTEHQFNVGLRYRF